MQTSIATTNESGIGSRAAACAHPERLGQWELVEPAAEGSLARIYRARPAGSPQDRPALYAVKVLHERWNDEPRARMLFCREAQLGRTIVHPHLVSILTAGLARPPYYLVMPWLEGQTLRRQLDDGTVPELPAALWMARQTAEALDALAAAGWRHGDLKPSNLFVSSDGHVTVLDLGLARRVEESDSVLDRCVTGTCQYLAPETITSTLASDIRSDIYSLGVVLFELLTGRLPFEGNTLETIVEQHREAQVPDPRRFVPHVPKEVARLIRQMLAKEPLRRPQTTAELIESLTRLEILSFGQRVIG
jgi:serine/threonine protein kinase